MDIKEVTVKKHFNNISQKLGAYGKTEALDKAIKAKSLLENMNCKMPVETIRIENLFCHLR
jgi:hypothetical protein